MHPSPLALLLFPALIPPAVAQCPTDALEPNDTCAGAPLVAPGTYPGLHGRFDLDPDHLRFAVLAGERWELALSTEDGADSVFVQVFEDDGGSPCAADSRIAATFASSPGGLLSGTAVEDGELLVQIDGFGADCVAYELSLAVFPDPCGALPDPGSEDNDTCATALPLAPGATSAEFAWQGDPDHYRVTIDPGSLLTVEAVPTDPGGNVTLLHWDEAAACDPDQAVSGYIFSGLRTFAYLYNPGPAAEERVVRIDTTPLVPGGPHCTSYDLTATAQADPCGLVAGDGFEPNDSCAQAAPLAGSAAGLSLAIGAPDWYSIVVPAHSTLRVLASPEVPGTHLVTQLFGGCAQSDWLTSGAAPGPGSSDELLEWTNDSDVDRSTRLHVTLSGPNAFCTRYSLELATTLGRPFCPPVFGPHQGLARLEAQGSTVVGTGTLELVAAPLPDGQPGLVFLGPAQRPPLPFGNGLLCVEGPIVRLPVGTATGAQLRTTLDWSAPGAAAVVQPGDTWFLQAWYRDPAAGGAAFDLSRGLELRFQ